jgi:hypothetical protein
MKGHGEKLSRKKEAALKALLENDTLAEAAKAAGIGEVTLWRWLQEPDFKEAFRNAKRRILDQAITNLQRATNKAINALVCVVEDSEASASARVSGARSILELAIKVTEIQALESRIEELEHSAGIR